jgi:hypothetical protein
MGNLSLILVRALPILLAGVFTQTLPAAGNPSAPNSPLRDFVTRRGGRLFEGTNEFRFLGLAAPNLHQNESQMHPDFSSRFPDEFEITDTLESLCQLGARATRCFSLSIRGPESNGAPVYIEGPGRYNEAAFRTFDKVLQIANKKGIRLILPVIASQTFWGWRGVDEFAAFRGQPGTNFWTDALLKRDFKDLLSYLVNRTNTFTGIQYRNDPAILAWQVGNELMNYVWERHLDEAVLKPRITAWTIEMADYLKQIDTNHLVMEAGGDKDAYLAAPSIDILSEHLYEYWARQTGQSYDLPRLAREAKEHAGDQKAVIVDEFGLGETLRLEHLMDAIVQSDISGGLLWSIRSHRRDGGFYYHNEAGTRWNSYHWPGFSAGESYDESRLLAFLSRKAYEIRGLPLPPVSAPTGKPSLFPVGFAGELRWRGCIGANGYDIARAPAPDGPWTIIAEQVEDVNVSDVIIFEDSKVAQPPALYIDKTLSSGRTWYYRTQGRNSSGATAWSNVQPRNGR